MEALPFRRPVIQYKYNKGAQEQTTFPASQKCKLFLLHYMYIFYLVFVSLLAWGNHLFLIDNCLMLFYCTVLLFILHVFYS